MNRAGSIAALSVLTAFLAVPPLGAARAATEVLTYAVEHPKYGDIGTYTNTVSENGNSAEVHTELHVAVKVIGIPLFHQDAKRTEEWKGHRLVAFHGATNDNGTMIDVTGKAEGGNFVIHSSAHGTVTAPARVHPSNPWAPFVLETDKMMSTKTGKVTTVVVKDTGEVTIELDGHPTRVHQWFVDDNKHQVVWIDDRGVVVGFQTPEEGAPIDFFLKRKTTVTAQSPRTGSFTATDVAN